MGHKRHFSQGGRHESDKQRRDERLLRKTIKEKQVAVLDRPMPVIDLGTEQISATIREVVGDFDDTFQDAWVRVLEEQPATLDDIRELARECSKRNATEYVGNQCRTRSINTPLTDEPESNTLADILPAKPMVSDIEVEYNFDAENQYTATSTGKINRQGHIHLDGEVYQLIKARFPHDPLNHAIRKLAGLPPPERDKLGWHKWEDELIKTRYPWGGSRAVEMDLNRSSMAITERARTLHIKAGKSLNAYKPIPEWTNIPEVAEELGCSWMVANRLIRNGDIEAIRIPNYHQGHTGIFVTPESLNNYKEGKPTSIKQYRDKLKAEVLIVKEEYRNKFKAELLKAKAKYRDKLKALSQGKQFRQRRVALKIERLSWLKQQAALKIVRQSRLEISNMQRHLTTTQNNLISKETELKNREVKLEQKEFNYNAQRSVNLNKAIAELKESPETYKVAWKGELSHFVFLKDGDLFSLCRPNDFPMPIETITKYNYDPFTEGLPSCRKCLNTLKSRMEQPATKEQ